MIYVKVNGQERGITFMHEKAEVETKDGKKSKQPFRTTCIIVDPQSKETLATGVAKVDSRDRFTYRDGRKYSLRHALTAAEMDRDQRSQVWTQVLSKVNY